VTTRQPDLPAQGPGSTPGLARCPYLAFKWDRQLSALNATLEHRCHSVDRAVSLAEQTVKCLTPEYPACEYYRVPTASVFEAAPAAPKLHLPPWLLAFPALALALGIILGRMVL